MTNAGAIWTDEPLVIDGHLISSRTPTDLAVFAKAFVDAKIKPARLLELAFISIDWAAAVELALGWKGFEDAAWWFYAHMRTDTWTINKEVRDRREGQASERTDLTLDSRSEGAIDSPWYHRIRPNFDAKQWSEIKKVAKFASSGSGHSRAKLYSDVIDGLVPAEDLIKRIQEKRNTDSVCALGLAHFDEDPESEVRSRFAIFQEFLRTSKQFGSMRQNTEKGVVSVGLENLARLAGYPDSLRLTWALEAKEAEDLKGDGLTVEAGDVSEIGRASLGKECRSRWSPYH